MNMNLAAGEVHVGAGESIGILERWLSARKRHLLIARSASSSSVTLRPDS